MSQLNQPEKESLKPADTSKPKEPDHQASLSNGVWETLKHDYGKPAAWVEGNVLAPLYNEAVVKPVNTVADAAQSMGAHITKLEKAEVAQSSVNSAGFYAQTMASSAGSLGWQLLAGHVVGKGMRHFGEGLAKDAHIAGFKPETAQTIRNVASSRMLHNVFGAAAVGATFAPEEGQSRTGNALSAAEGMLLFEGTNKLVGTNKFFDAKAMALRAATGAPIGASQQFLSTLVTTGKADTDASHYTKAMASGAFMNVMMPGAVKGMEAIAPKLGINAYADRFAEQQHEKAVDGLKAGASAEPGSWGDPNAARLAIAAGRMDITAKARLSEIENSSVNHAKGLITLKKGDSPSVFVEENAHIKIASDPKFEEGFTKAAALMEGGKTEEARQQYIETRLAQEVEAHKARFDAIEKSGAKTESTSIDPAAIAKEYAGKFALEARAFVMSGGSFRPEMSFSHGDGGFHAGGDGVSFTQSVGIGPHASHDGAPHVVGDTGSTTEAQRGAPEQIGTPSRQAILDGLPPNATNISSGPGFKYAWRSDPDGVTIMGHDHVKTMAFTADLSEIVLEKIDPVTKELASTVYNFSEGQPYKLDNGTTGFTFKEMETNEHIGQNIYQVDKAGTWAMPEGATWETYSRRVNLDIGGQPVWVSNILRHNDATGRIDYKVAGSDINITEHTVPQAIGDYPETLNPATGKFEYSWKPGDEVPINADGKPAFFLTQRSIDHSDGSTTSYIFDPRKLDPNFPKEKLMPDASVETAPPGKLLKTSLGEFNEVYRFSDDIRYNNDNETKVVQFDGDRLRVISIKGDDPPVIEHVDSIKESYPEGKDTSWGKAVEIDIKPKSMLVTLQNGAKVEIFNAQAYPDGAPYEPKLADGSVDPRFANNRFGNVRRVDTAPPFKNVDGSVTPGDISLIREIKSPEGNTYSTIHVPPKPVPSNMFPNTMIDAFEEFPGAKNQTTFYLSDAIDSKGQRIPYGTIEVNSNGYQTDGILKNGPYDAIWRHSGGIAFLKRENNGANGWTKSSFTFGDPTTSNPPMLILNRDIGEHPNDGQSQAFRPEDLWYNDANNQVRTRPLVTEPYPNGQVTPWGVALQRGTYMDGTALISMKDGSHVVVDKANQFIQRIPAS